MPSLSNVVLTVLFKRKPSRWLAKFKGTFYAVLFCALNVMYALTNVALH